MDVMQLLEFNTQLTISNVVGTPVSTSYSSRINSSIDTFSLRKRVTQK